MAHDVATDQPTLQADRFVLRAPRKSDAGLIALYASDERVARDSRAIPHPLPPGAVEAMIACALSLERTEDTYVIDGSAFGHAEAIGVISLNKMDRDQTEIYFWIAPAFWNTGFATEAVNTVINANPTHALRYFAESFQDNPKSARVLTNCGFDYLGDAEAFSVARNTVLPTWTYTRKMGT